MEIRNWLQKKSEGQLYIVLSKNEVVLIMLLILVNEPDSFSLACVVVTFSVKKQTQYTNQFIFKDLMYIEVVQPGSVVEVTIAADSFSAAMFDLVWKNKYTYTHILCYWF